MRSELTRRAAIAGAGALLVSLAVPGGPAQALTPAAAQAMITETVAEVFGVIDSGRSEGQMLADFERILVRRADVDYIARRALGPAARSASAAELAAYTQAAQGYIARKYGRRFREFIGGRIDINGTRTGDNFVEVISTAHLRGEAPFEVRWVVSDRSGRPLFIDLVIEGVSLLLSEGQEIRALLDRNRGSIAGLTEDLRRAG